MEKNIPIIEPALKLLLEEMKASDWTIEAIEFVKRSMSCHEALLEVVKEALCHLDPNCEYDGANANGKEVSDYSKLVIAMYEVIAKAEGK